MITGLLPKLGIGVLGLGTVAASGYGVYELARTKTISEILGREHRVLKTEGDEDKNDWDELVKKYKEESNSSKKIKDLDLEEGTGKDDSNKKKLKEKCKNLLVSFYKDEKQQEYLDAKNWCTNSLLTKKI